MSIKWANLFFISAKMYLSRIVGERLCVLVLSFYQIEASLFLFFIFFYCF